MHFNSFISHEIYHMKYTTDYHSDENFKQLDFQAMGYSINGIFKLL